MSHYNRRAERDPMMRYEKLLPHILDLAALDDAALDATALATAKLSFYDWLVVSCAGSAEPLAVIMRDFIASEAGTPTASVTGSAQKFPARAAALANGTISHALDYDDTHFAYVGHPSVAIFPAALAAAEEVGASGADVCKAFLLGAEVSCRIGMVLGRRHYDAGFHQTATAGCFGATVAAARLYQLDSAALCGALGLASTRASGLKSQFGTMGKPFNAGMAAANAIEACGLAARFRQDGTIQDLIDQLERGIPAPVGWLHLGPVEQPTGVGHWSVVVGWEPSSRTFLMHDPNGEADLVGGGYVSTALGSGRAQRYSERNWGRRWLVEGPGSGWWMGFGQP